jgi:SAM-dependent methyltransferase
MPTTPIEPTRPAGGEAHQHRQMAESFGVDAARYDRARPAYPDALIARIVAGSPGRDVLDVGCGTGIAARQFRAAGCTVLGVEPDARMAGFARGTGIDVEVATFEDWPAAGRTFDAVVSGQAWHWIEPAGGAAKTVEVLRPGGRWAIFSHIFEPPEPVGQAQAAAVERLVPDLPVTFRGRPGAARSGYRTMFAKVLDAMRETGVFGEPEEWRYEWDRPYGRDEWLDLLPTTGILTRVSPEVLAGVRAEVGAAIDALGGSITTHFVTQGLSAVRTG